MTEREATFSSCWDTDARRVLAYATRHCGPNDAAEVVSETFLHAWRTWDSVPTPALPWLIGTARNVIRNLRRGQQRQTALKDRLVFLNAVARSSADISVLATERAAALERLADLSEEHREALLLVAWDGLSPTEAAEALGVREGTFRVRLHRARKALEKPASGTHTIPCNDEEKV